MRKLNVSDFEAHISDIILERGWDYYRNDRVKSIEKDSRNTYTAIVAGTEDYKVTVKVGENGEIESADCDCPYDMGPYCKHKVAVFYSLRDIMKHGSAGILSNSTDIRDASASESGTMTHSPKDSPCERFQKILSSRHRRGRITQAS